MKPLLVAAALVGAMSVASAPAAAQSRARAGRQGQEVGRGADEANISPAEIRRMFDSYALMQAQEQLKISDEQFPKFLRRFMALQDLRRRTQMERNRMLADLRRLTSDSQADEAALKERVKALQEAEDRSLAEMRKAYEAIDDVLDARQQARFRVFEEQMEQRMLQLITRARAANRPKP
jgi:Spy/CpxP family protein refolding chaperone